MDPADLSLLTLTTLLTLSMMPPAARVKLCLRAVELELGERDESAMLRGVRGATSAGVVDVLAAAATAVVD